MVVCTGEPTIPHEGVWSSVGGYGGTISAKTHFSSGICTDNLTLLWQAAAGNEQSDATITPTAKAMTAHLNPFAPLRLCVPLSVLNPWVPPKQNVFGGSSRPVWA